MRIDETSLALALSSTILLTGCTKPPEADVARARAALESAKSAGAEQHAPESLRAAEEAQAALDTEIHQQGARWFKSYDRTKSLAEAAAAAGNDAAARASAAKERHAASEKQEKTSASRARVTAPAAASAPISGTGNQFAGKVEPPVKIKDVKPVYPAVAKSARITGTVQVEATIGPDGKVVDTRVVRSVPMLDEAALDAVRQWEYRPSLQNGNPVPSVMTVNVNFVL